LRGGEPDIHELIQKLHDLRSNAELLDTLKPEGRPALLSRLRRIVHLLDRLFLRAFEDGLPGDLLSRIEDLSSSSEELHDDLLVADLPPGPPTGTVWDLASLLITASLDEVEAGLSSALNRAGESFLKLVLDRSIRLVEGLRGLLREINQVSPSAPAHHILSSVPRLLPDKAGLAGYYVFLRVLPRYKTRRREFVNILAELISKKFLREEPPLGRCFSFYDVAEWASQVLKTGLSRDDITKALRILEERGDILILDMKRGLVVLPVEEEDLREVMELARERYRVSGSGVNANLLSEHFGWCLEYASRVIEELVRRKQLFPGPSKIGVGEEYYPPPEGW